MSWRAGLVEEPGTLADGVVPVGKVNGGQPVKNVGGAGDWLAVGVVEDAVLDTGLAIDLLGINLDAANGGCRAPRLAACVAAMGNTWAADTG